MFSPISSPLFLSDKLSYVALSYEVAKYKPKESLFDHISNNKNISYVAFIHFVIKYTNLLL